MEDSDTDLVCAAIAGDKAAYAGLVARHRAMVVGVCRRMLGDAGLAEDAAQEAVLAALLDLDRLREPARFGAWLAGIALNVCRGWLRERTRPGLPASAAVEPDPAEVAEAAEIAARVRRAVAGLPSGQRQAVVAFYLGDRSQADVAELLGIQVGAVKARLHKARATLRGQLADLREEPPVTDQPVTMRIADVHRLPGKQGELDPHVVVLTEVGGDRQLPIWTGPAEGLALALALVSTEMPPRPPTHRFAAGLLDAAGGRLVACRITRLAEGTFYAEAVVEGPAGTAVVDARPSDALNLAQLLDVPITVDAEVLERALREAAFAGGNGARDVVEHWQALRPSP